MLTIRRLPIAFLICADIVAVSNIGYYGVYGDNHDRKEAIYAPGSSLLNFEPNGEWGRITRFERVW